MSIWLQCFESLKEMLAVSHDSAHSCVMDKYFHSDKAEQPNGPSRESWIWSLALPIAQDWQVSFMEVLESKVTPAQLSQQWFKSGPTAVSFFSSEFNSSLSYPHFTSLAKLTEVHSCELYHTFLQAGHFLRPLLHFTLHTRFHWYLSISDISYQIKYNQAFLPSVTLALSNLYCFVHCHHHNLLPVFH